MSGTRKRTPSPFFSDANWAADADGQSDVAWLYLHQGGRYDATAGLYHFRNRDYDPSLGRWISTDPLSYVDGANLYQYVLSNPNRLDPFGTDTNSDGGSLDDPNNPYNSFTSQRLRQRIMRLYQRAQDAFADGNEELGEALAEEMRDLEQQIRDADFPDPTEMNMELCDPQMTTNYGEAARQAAEALADALEAAQQGAQQVAQELADALEAAQDDALTAGAAVIVIIIGGLVVVVGAY